MGSIVNHYTAQHADDLLLEDKLFLIIARMAETAGFSVVYDPTQSLVVIETPDAHAVWQLSRTDYKYDWPGKKVSLIEKPPIISMDELLDLLSALVGSKPAKATKKEG